MYKLLKKQKVYIDLMPYNILIGLNGLKWEQQLLYLMEHIKNY